MALSLCRTTVDDSARELMEHGTAAFPIACYHDDLQAEPVPWHWHEELEVLVVSEGMILATAGGEKFRLGKGEGLFINAGVLHGDWPLNAGSCRLHSMVFHPRLVGGNPDSVFWQKYLQPLLTDPSRPCAVLRPTVDWQHEAIEDMERAFRAVVNEIPGYEFKTRAALSEMIFQLVSHAPAVQAMPEKGTAQRRPHQDDAAIYPRALRRGHLGRTGRVQCVHQPQRVSAVLPQYDRHDTESVSARPTRPARGGAAVRHGTAGDGNRDAVRFSGRELLCPRLPPGLRLRPDGVSQKSTKGKIKLPPSVP